MKREEIMRFKGKVFCNHEQRPIQLIDFAFDGKEGTMRAIIFDLTIGQLEVIDIATFFEKVSLDSVIPSDIIVPRVTANNFEAFESNQHEFLYSYSETFSKEYWIKEIIEECHTQVYKMHQKGIEPKRVVMSTKAYEGVIALSYQYVRSSSMSVFMGLELIVDSSLSDKEIKVLASNDDELFRLNRKK